MVRRGAARVVLGKTDSPCSTLALLAIQFRAAVTRYDRTGPVRSLVGVDDDERYLSVLFLLHIDERFIQQFSHGGESALPIGECRQDCFTHFNLQGWVSIERYAQHVVRPGSWQVKNLDTIYTSRRRRLNATKRQAGPGDEQPRLAGAVCKLETNVSRIALEWLGVRGIERLEPVCGRRPTCLSWPHGDSHLWCSPIRPYPLTYVPSAGAHRYVGVGRAWSAVAAGRSVHAAACSTVPAPRTRTSSRESRPNGVKGGGDARTSEFGSSHAAAS
jgi:hypothetical protein